MFYLKLMKLCCDILVLLSCIPLFIGLCKVSEVHSFPSILIRIQYAVHIRVCTQTWCKQYQQRKGPFGLGWKLAKLDSLSSETDWIAWPALAAMLSPFRLVSTPSSDKLTFFIASGSPMLANFPISNDDLDRDEDEPLTMLGTFCTFRPSHAITGFVGNWFFLLKDPEHFFSSNLVWISRNNGLFYYHGLPPISSRWPLTLSSPATF